MEKKESREKGKKEENCQSKKEAGNYDSSDIKSLKEMIIKKDEAEQMYLDQLKRLKAEFDNYRKRMEKKNAEILKIGERELAKDVLSVLDNLQRAIDYEHIDLEGVELIKKELFNILLKRGLKCLDAKGCTFDHNLHHAVSFCEVDDSIEDGKVIEVLQPGYFWNEEVLRPAMVITAKRREEKQCDEMEKDEEENNDNIESDEENSKSEF